MSDDDNETCPHCRCVAHIDVWDCMGGMNETGEDVLWCPDCGKSSTHSERNKPVEPTLFD